MTFSQKVLDYVRHNPGSTSVAVGDYHGTGIHQASSALGHLYTDGLLARYRVGRSYHYVAAEAVELARPNAENSQTSCDKHEATIAGLQDEVATVREANVLARRYLDEAQAQIVALNQQREELAAWRDAAIEKHPDLRPADPLIAKAREIVASLNEDETWWAEDVLLGLHDDHIEVRIALAALRNTEA